MSSFGLLPGFFHDNQCSKRFWNCGPKTLDISGLVSLSKISEILVLLIQTLLVGSSS